MLSVFISQSSGVAVLTSFIYNKVFAGAPDAALKSILLTTSSSFRPRMYYIVFA